jgi:hypothetical protein
MARWLFIAIPAVVLCACSSDDERYEHSHRPRYAVDCSEFTSCGTCTPVLGCGWCQFEDGSGRCASGPSRCGETFRWNWEPEACPVAPKSDAGPVDATPVSDASDDAAPESGTDAPVTSDAPAEETTSEDAAAPDAPAEETATDDTGAADTGTATDTGPKECLAPWLPTGCAQSFGGTLCGAGQYTLGCATAVKPDPSLGCTSKLTEGGTTHYCCTCK